MIKEKKKNWTREELRTTSRRGLQRLISLVLEREPTFIF